MRHHEYTSEVDKLNSKIALGQSLIKLKHNNDFKVLVEIFTKAKVLELTNKLGANTLSKEEKEHIFLQIQASGIFDAFIKSIDVEAKLAAQQLSQLVALYSNNSEGNNE